MAETDLALSIKGLTKSFGRKVVDNLDLAVRRLERAVAKLTRS